MHTHLLIACSIHAHALTTTHVILTLHVWMHRSSRSPALTPWLWHAASPRRREYFVVFPRVLLSSLRSRLATSECPIWSICVCNTHTHKKKHTRESGNIFRTQIQKKTVEILFKHRHTKMVQEKYFRNTNTHTQNHQKKKYKYWQKVHKITGPRWRASVLWPWSRPSASATSPPLSFLSCLRSPRPRLPRKSSSEVCLHNDNESQCQCAKPERCTPAVFFF